MKARLVLAVYLIISLVLCAQQLGQECPPCERLKNEISQQKIKIDKLKAQRERLKKELDELQANIDAKYDIAMNALRNAILTCASALFYPVMHGACISAEKDAAEATVELGLARYEYTLTLNIFNDLTNTIENEIRFYNRLVGEYNECMARKPGACQKCSDGIIVAGENGKRYNECSECEEGQLVDTDEYCDDLWICKDSKTLEMYESFCMLGDCHTLDTPTITFTANECQECVGEQIEDKVCPPGQKCCNDECVPIEYYYIITFTTTICGRDIVHNYESDSPCPSPNDNKPGLSIGDCEESATTTCSDSGPYERDCK